MSDFVEGLRAGFRGLGGERAGARARLRAALPDRVRDARHQWLGTISSGCAATHDVYERCNFSCTACYLSNEANQTPPLPFHEVKAQLDTIRATLGPGANAQITAGEVTLLPRDELVRIVRYARSIELDPMVMTHGQTFLDEPDYLYALMSEGGLEKVAIHIDTTQRGRPFLKKGMTETDLHPLRDRFAALIRQARVTTGRSLHAAHTFTVTQENLGSVHDVVRWVARNNDAFRMISLQPTADVGRTRIAAAKDLDAVWGGVEAGLGGAANRHTFTFGDADCNLTCLAWVVRFDDELHVLEVKRQGAAVDELFFDELMASAFTGFYTDGATGAELWGRFAGLLLRSPKLVWQWPAYSAYRALGAREWVKRFLSAVARGHAWSVRPLVVVVHNFMSRDELTTPRGRERLAACAFKVPVREGAHGELRMVSMCEMNGTELRARANRETRELYSIGASGLSSTAPGST